MTSNISLNNLPSTQGAGVFKQFYADRSASLQALGEKKKSPYLEEQEKIYKQKQKELAVYSKNAKTAANFCVASVIFTLAANLGFRAFKKFPSKNVDEIRRLADKMFKESGVSEKGGKVYAAAEKIISKKGKDITANMKKRAGSGGYYYGENISFSWADFPDSIFHEVGHQIEAHKKFIVPKLWLDKNLPRLGASVAALSLIDTRKENIENSKLQKNNGSLKSLKDASPYLIPFAFLPRLFNEGMATGHALKFLKQNSKHHFNKNLAFLSFAFGTYLSIPIALTACACALKNRLDMFFTQKSMYNQSQDVKKNLKFDESVSPKIAMIDDFNAKSIRIDSDRTPDITHGRAVESFIKSGLPNAQITRLDTNIDESSVSGALDYVLNSEEKYDAINISKASYITYKELSKIVGTKITSENIAQHKNEVKKKLCSSEYKDIEYLKKIIDNLEKISQKGTKIYVAAGNNKNKSLNIYTLADGVNVVGATKKYGSVAPFSPSKGLVNRFERGQFRIKKVKDENGNKGFDFTQNGKIDVMENETSSRLKLAIFDLYGTSFATPQALVRDFKKQIN